MSEPTFEPVLYAYAGERLNHRGELYLLLLPIANDGRPDEREEFAFKHDRKTARAFSVGAVYEIPTATKDAGGRSLRFGQAKQIRWLESAEREGFQAAHQTALAMVESERQAARLVKSDQQLTKTLAPLAKHYQALRTTRERLAFELLVITALRRAQG